jgi:hypothetical protein
MFDTANPHYMKEYSSLRRFQARHVARLTALRALQLSQIPGFIARSVMARISKVGVRFRRSAYKLRLRSQMRQDDPPEDVFRVRRSSTRYYKPKPYPGRVLLFQGTQLVSGRYREPKYGWGDLVKGGLEISVVRGDHLDLFDEENIEPTALELRSRLFETQHEYGSYQARFLEDSASVG